MRHFRNQQDLVVLAVDAGRLGGGLKWEPSRGGALFPHFYGDLAADLVLDVWSAPLDSDGVPRLPDLAP